MLLRSSSTPILGSLLSSTAPSLHISDSPDHTTHNHHHSNPSLHPISSPVGFSRRTRSDGNLHSLLLLDSNSHHHHHHNSPPLKPSFLEGSPSLSIYNTVLIEEGKDPEEEEEEEEEEEDDGGGGGGDEFAFSGSIPHRETPLFLARGLGIDRVASGLLTAGYDGTGGGGRGTCGLVTGGGDGGEQSDIDGYYKRMMEEDPSNAVLLRNYAEFLYQVKGDAQRSEEYYSRAILADPSDGDILSQYAKLVWELHHDVERASSYFEQAVRVAPQNSHVLASYAEFLWDTDDGDDGKGDEGVDQPQHFFKLPLYHGALTSATT